ncbi:choice-of-anchor tandem repeat GloVer-containing protein [Flavobacterium rhizosphaerae]|uniref:Choice-of-anchor tandem repeat GloVer-containing protein n=1 Tax=Flavobacterium rhizosphaerae TaxID=3163298 RepID=A0ABW8YY34_9FLAO
MKTKLLITFLLVVNSLSAQKEFWGLANRGGTATGNLGLGYGAIIKTDASGANAQMVHVFDSINGMQPNGRLLLASNGKLYGTTYFGGNVQLNGNTDGVLFEYDPIGNEFSVVSLFGTGDFPTIRNPKCGVIEALEGQLFGAAGVGIYKHNLTDEETSLAALVTVSYTGMNAFPNSINGELMKASDGYIYGTTKNYSMCPASSPYMGCIVRFNPATPTSTNPKMH